MPPNVPYKKQAGVVTSLVRVREQDIETEFLTRLDGLKYILRPDIRDRAALEQNFREKFESLNRVRRDGYTRFKAEKNAAELVAIATRHHLATVALQTFVDGILQRMIFDGEQLGDLMAPLDLGWKARTQAELALMDDLTPLLRKRAQGRDISGLNAYES